MNRGPKPKTARNSRDGAVPIVGKRRLDSPTDLDEATKREYDRFVRVLDEFGTLPIVDTVVIANAAWTKVMLDAAVKDAGSKPDLKTLKGIVMLTTQLRGLMREMGLTTTPSRHSIRAGRKDNGKSKWADVFKFK